MNELCSGHRLARRRAGVLWLLFTYYSRGHGITFLRGCASVLT